MAQRRDRSLYYVLGFAALVVGLTLWQQSRREGAAGSGDGKPAPDFAVRRLGGEELRLSSLRGKVVLVDFWARWCDPCVKLMPALHRLHEGLAGKPFELLSVNVEPVPAGTVQAWLREKGLSFSAAQDAGGEAQRACGVNALPRLLLVDAAGLLRRSYGARAQPDELRRDIEALLPTGS